jgi:hypothetical protein
VYSLQGEQLHTSSQEFDAASGVLQSDDLYTPAAQQQQAQDAARQQAFQAIFAVQQQLALVAASTPSAAAHTQQATADLGIPAEAASSLSPSAPVSQSAAGHVAAAVTSLNEAIEGATQGADKTTGELSTLVTVLTGQLQRFEQRGSAMANTAFMPGLLDAAEVSRLSAGAVGDVWDPVNHASAAAATWSPLDSAELARLSAAAVGDIWPDNLMAFELAPEQQAQRVPQPQPHLGASTASAAVQQQQQQPSVPLQKAPAAAAVHGPQHQHAQPAAGLSPLQKLLIIDAAIVEPQWKKFAAAATGWAHMGMQTALQEVGAVAAQLQSQTAAAAQQVQDAAAPAAAKLRDTATATAAKAHVQVAQGAAEVSAKAAATASQLQKQAAGAVEHLLQSDAAALASQLHAKAASATAELQQTAAAAAAQAAAALEEAKSRADGKGPGERRTWQEEVLACSGILSLISPYWWSEETISGTAYVAHAASAANADAEPLVQGAYGSDGNGMDDGSGNGAGGSGRGQGPNSGNNEGAGDAGAGDDASSGGVGGDGGSGHGNGGGQGGSGGGKGGNGAAGSGPWDGFDQFPPPGGFDPVMLIPVALAAATAGLTSLFGTSSSSSSSGKPNVSRRSRTSANPAQREALKLFKNSSSSNSGQASTSLPAASAGTEVRQREVHGRLADRAAVTAGDVQSAVAAGASLLGPSAVPVASASQADIHVWDATDHAPHLHLYAHDQPVLFLSGPETTGTAARSHVSLARGSAAPWAGAGMLQQEAPTHHSPRKAGSRAQPSSALVEAFSTSQQITWEELEELPLAAKQEILSLRAAAAANRQQQRALQKQLQQVEQQLGVKDQELAASAAQATIWQAEHAAALAELQNLSQAAAGGSCSSEAADCNKANGVSADQLRSTYAAQIAHLTKEAAAASCAATLQIAALQAQLEAQQQSAADAVASLEMRLAKTAASKAKVDLRYASDIAARDAQLADSQDQEVQLQHALQEAMLALEDSQQELLAGQAVQEQLQQELDAAHAAKEQQAAALQAYSSRVAALEAELSAAAADLAAAKELTSKLEQQVQDSNSQTKQIQASAALDSTQALARVAELTAELDGLKTGYVPLLQGLELELASERTKAQQQVAELQQRWVDAEAGINTQMHLLQQQLQDARTSCAAAAAQSDSLQQQLDAMQQQQQAVVAELKLTKEASAAQVAQFKLTMQNLHQRMQQAKTAAFGTTQTDTRSAVDAATESLQLDGIQQPAESLQTQQLQPTLPDDPHHVASPEVEFANLLAEAAAAGQQLEALCSSSRQQVEDAHAKLEAERSAAQGRLAALTAELQGVRTGYTTFVAQLETELAAERSFSRRQVSEVKEQLDQAQAQLAELQQHLQQLETDKAALEADHATLLDASSTQQQATADELSGLRQQVQLVKQQEAAALERCTYLEAELAAATAEAAEEAALRQQLERQRTNLLAQVRAVCCVA